MNMLQRNLRAVWGREEVPSSPSSTGIKHAIKEIKNNKLL
jgi:hypothetical protein